MNPEIKLISEAYIGMLQPKTKLSITEKQLYEMTVEEFDAIDEDQLDELSKATLRSYVGKASKSVPDLLNKAQKHFKKSNDFENKILNIRNPDSDRGDQAVERLRDQAVDHEDAGFAAHTKALDRSKNVSKAVLRAKNKDDWTRGGKPYNHESMLQSKTDPVLNEERFDFDEPAAGHKVVRQNEKGGTQSGTITKVTPDKIHVLYKGQKTETVHDHEDLDNLPSGHRPKGYKDHAWASYHDNDGIKTA